MSISVLRLLMVASLGLTVAACGTNPKQRGLSGGAIGAGTGAVVGAVTGLSVLQGVAIGAGVGAVVGAVTDNSQINLGSLGSGSQKSGSSAHQASNNSGTPRATLAASPLVEDVQAALGRAGYNAGPADGLAGPRTTKAITAYQRDNGLATDGEPSAELLQHLLSRKT